MGPRNIARIRDFLDLWGNFDSPERFGAILEHVSWGLTSGGFRRHSRRWHRATRAPPESLIVRRDVSLWVKVSATIIIVVATFGVFLVASQVHDVRQ